MSVINKMLQDLDARESSSSAINADYQPPQNKSKSVLWLVLILVLLVSLVAGFFILSHGLEQNTHQDMAVKSTIDEEIVNSATATPQIDLPQEQPSSVAKVQQNMVVEAETIMVAEENTQSKTDSNHLVDSSNADSPMSLISSAEQKESRQSDDVIQTNNDQSDRTDNQYSRAVRCG